MVNPLLSCSCLRHPWRSSRYLSLILHIPLQPPFGLLKLLGWSTKTTFVSSKVSSAWKHANVRRNTLVFGSRIYWYRNGRQVRCHERLVIADILGDATSLHLLKLVLSLIVSSSKPVDRSRVIHQYLITACDLSILFIDETQDARYSVGSVTSSRILFHIQNSYSLLTDSTSIIHHS